LHASKNLVPFAHLLLILEVKSASNILQHQTMMILNQGKYQFNRNFD